MWIQTFARAVPGWLRIHFLIFLWYLQFDKRFTSKYSILLSYSLKINYFECIASPVPCLETCGHTFWLNVIWIRDWWNTTAFAIDLWAVFGCMLGCNKKLLSQSDLQLKIYKYCPVQVEGNILPWLQDPYFLLPLFSLLNSSPPPLYLTFQPLPPFCPTSFCRVFRSHSGGIIFRQPALLLLLFPPMES